MSIQNFFRFLLAASAFAVSAQSSATPIISVNGDGALTGVHNLDVDGTLYDVRFADGSCNSLFNGCSSFAFTTDAALNRGYVSLAEQVLQNDFYNINGCASRDSCNIRFLYRIADTGVIGYFLIRQSNGVYGATPLGSHGSLAGYADVDTTNFPTSTYGIFALAAPDDPASVPEPSSIALFLLAMGGMAAKRRRLSNAPKAQFMRCN